MEKLTSESINEFFKSIGQECSVIATDDWQVGEDEEGNLLEEDYYIPKFEEFFGEIKTVDHGESRHDGSTITEVYYFPKYDQYFKLTGRYSSWGENSYHDEMEEVFPKTKTITYYE